MSNPFFSNCGPFYISEILKLLDISSEIKEKHKVKDIVDLFNAEKGCITFFHSKKYNEIAKKTKASFCITTKNLKDYLPQEVQEFESSTDNCSFKIEQLPKMSLQITEKHAYEKIKFESNESQIPFHMYCYIEKNDDNSSNVVIEINMEVNFMMKMLVQKPINIFLEKFTEIIKRI